jgi:signal transduction histidine kinase
MLSLRMRLALVYAGVFFITGLLLLLLPFFQVKDAVHVGSGALPPPPSVSTGPLISQPVALVVLAVISLGLGWLIAGRLLRPLRVITATAREISATNLSRRLNLGPRRHRDEFAELGETLDGLLQRLQASFDSQRHFVANAAHELRTPLTAERALLQVALADPGADTGTLRAACAEVLRLGERTEGLIDALLTLATGEQGVERPEPFDLAELAGKTVAGRGGEAAARGLRVDEALGTAPAAGDARLAESLVANLVDNALRHNTADGWISVTTGILDGHAILAVRNTGPAVPPGEVDRLFEPFRRLGGSRLSRAASGFPASSVPKNSGTGSGSGHGLGLAIVAAIARAHDATITARARPEGGLDVQVSFPGPAPRLGTGSGVAQPEDEVAEDHRAERPQAQDTQALPGSKRQGVHAHGVQDVLSGGHRAGLFHVPGPGGVRDEGRGDREHEQQAEDEPDRHTGVPDGRGDPEGE